MEEVGTPGCLLVDGKKKPFEILEISLRVDRYVSRASNMNDFDENTNPNTFDNSTYQINVFLSIQSNACDKDFRSTVTLEIWERSEREYRHFQAQKLPNNRNSGSPAALFYPKAVFETMVRSSKGN